jgi:hypothetical protein
MIVTPGYGFELCAYRHLRENDMCQALNDSELRAKARTPAAWWELLDTPGATCSMRTRS